MRFSISSFFSTGFLAAICLSGAIASPMAEGALEVRQSGQTNELWKCWAPGNNAPDRNVNIPANHACTKAHALGDGTVQSFKYLSYGANPDYSLIETSNNAQTVGPWHCCYTCAQDSECIGWKIDLNPANGLCKCQIIKVKGCAAAKDILFTEKLSTGNSTGIYHPSSGTCKLN